MESTAGSAGSGSPSHTGGIEARQAPIRSAMLEQVSGYEFPFWNGLFAPAGTPKEQVDAVYRSVVRALETPEVRSRFSELGLTPVGNTPDEFAAAVKRDVAKFRKLILELGIPRL